MTRLRLRLRSILVLLCTMGSLASSARHSIDGDQQCEPHLERCIVILEDGQSHYYLKTDLSISRRQLLLPALYFSVTLHSSTLFLLFQHLLFLISTIYHLH